MLDFGFAIKCIYTLTINNIIMALSKNQKEYLRIFDQYQKNNGKAEDFESGPTSDEARAETWRKKADESMRKLLLIELNDNEKKELTEKYL